MGGLLLTLIEIAKTIVKLGSDEETATIIPTASIGESSSTAVLVTKLITYIFRFLFHCVQFTFLFRYGNVRTFSFM